MGNYNPFSPIILGQEWVPIKNEDITYSPSTDFVELGHEFTLTSATRPRDARFYINQLPPTPGLFQTTMFNIYPRGLEAETGPIQSVLIPCNNGGISGGAGISLGGGATSVAQALMSPGDGRYINNAYNSGVQTELSMFFAVNSYPQLANKRILNISFIYTGYACDGNALGTACKEPLIDADPNTPITVLNVANNSFNLRAYQKFYYANTGSLWQLSNTINSASATSATDQIFGTVNLGDINLFWDPAYTGGAYPVMPWRYVDLQRFEASAGTNRLHLHCIFQIPATTNGLSVNLGTVRLEYAALQVIYCEETRVAYGGYMSAGAFDTNYGANLITLRDTSLNTDPVLPAGNYTLTLSTVNPGDLNFGSGLDSEFPKLNGLRELYAMPPQEGVQVNIPTPLINRLGKTFTKEQTHVLPQLSLHTSGGPINGVHVYGRQAVAQVYGSVTAAQEILDTGLGEASYPQVRYYARRFGDTTVPLILAGCTAGGLLLTGTGTSNASTPDNAALDITGDIDLRVDATLSSSEWFSTSGKALVAKYNATGNQRAYRMYIENGLLRLSWSPDGSTVLAVSPDTAHVPDACGRLAVRVTLDVDDGGGNRVIRFYTAPTMSGTFTQLGSTITAAGTTSIFNSTASAFVGADGTGTGSLLTGIVHSAQILNGIAGPAAANPNFSAQTAGTTSFTDAAGRTWTINSPASIISGVDNSNVSITPDEFDVLDEITDGWKEVNLQFSTPPNMGGGGNPRWVWSATGELAGNRWEVLGAVAPALSGTPGNLYNLVPSPNQLSSATYGQPTSGATINLGWVPGYAPPVTATTDDQTSDAVLMFSQNPQTITGFSASTATQEVVGIGLDCGIDPCCIPTDIIYNRITWGLPVNTGVASDNFNRTVAAGGWGTASDGKAWTTSGTAADFSVNGSEGLIVPSAITSNRFAWVNVGGPDQDVRALVRIADTAESGQLNSGLVARLTDAGNNYCVEFRYGTATTELILRKRVASVATDLVTITPPGLYPNIYAWRYLRLQVSGNILRAKVWGVDEDEPDWMISTTDSSLTTGNNAGCFARDNTGAAAPSTFMFDNFTVGPPDYWFGAYELQRMDTIDTDWQTIMRATDVATTGFSDFEARTGVTSSYRIRGVNVYDFAGPWSSTVTAAIPSPGVSGSCLSDGHVLIFTSNERQDGSINLAYSSVWEDRVQEDFAFAEAGFVQMQAMYNRDFFTAFRPSERGGAQFQRTLLVQAAAISPPTLEDFTSLRDMAWDNVSYICVRDEEGNRWFATVLVPSGRVVHFRKVYMASVTVIEVTDTPSEVDP